MNDLDIFRLMAKTPAIRAVEIADALDKDLAEVSNAMRDLVNSGSVVQSKGVAPNGRQAMVYDFSEQFKATRDYAAVIAAVTAAPAAPAELPPARAPISTPVLADLTEPFPVVAAPAASKVLGADAGPSRAERAIAAILKDAPCSDSFLRGVMGIKQQEYPSTYLGGAVKAGKVHKSGTSWMPGRVAPAPAPVVPPRFNTPINPAKSAVPGFEEWVKADAAVASVAAAELSKPDQSVAVAWDGTISPARAAPPVFRCGLWSDGVLELQRDGAQVAKLTRGEGEELAAFLGRMLDTSTHRLRPHENA